MIFRWAVPFASLMTVCSISFAQVKDAGDSDWDDPLGRVLYEWTRLRDPATNRIPRSIRMRELRFAGSIPSKESFRGMNKGRAPMAVQSLDWSPRGPANVGGRTRALAIDITNPNLILAGGVSG